MSSLLLKHIEPDLRQLPQNLLSGDTVLLSSGAAKATTIKREHSNTIIKGRVASLVEFALSILIFFIFSNFRRL